MTDRDIVRARIAVAEEMLAIYRKLEPNALVQLTGGFAAAARVAR